jgi:altronate dehydratase
MKAVIDITKDPMGGFSAALDIAKHGDHIIYHVGECCGGVHKNAAMAASDAGWVTLCQRRKFGSRFEYIAQRTRSKS